MVAKNEKEKVLNLNFVEQKDLEATINFTDECITLLKADFSIRRRETKFKFMGKVLSQRFGALVLALVAIKARYVLDRDLDESDLLLCSAEDNAAKMVSSYFTDTIRMATDEDADLTGLKAIIARCLEELADMAFEVNQSAGNSINIYDMLQMMQRNPEVAALLKTKVREEAGAKVDYFEGNEKVKNANRQLLEAIIKDDEYNCYKNLLSAVSVGQFQQVFCNVGYKPEVTSSAIFPHCVDTNLFYGFRNEMDYFVSAMGARKALITNSLQVRRAGYMSRKLLLLVLNQKLSETKDCGTSNYLEMIIESKSALKRLNGRYRSVKGKLVKIDGRDQSMVGKKILLRTPITCCAEDGICQTCYGDLVKVNPFHIGISSVLSLTEQLTQMLLSSKHLLQINPEKVKLPEKMYEYFEIDGSNLIGKKHFKVNVTEIVVNDEEETVIKRMVVLDGDRQVEFDFADGEELVVLENPDMVSKYKTDNIIEVTNDGQENLFRINVENSELSTPLKNIIHLLESEARLNIESEEKDGNKKIRLSDPGNYHMILPEFLNLLERSNIRASSLTIELILRELLRDVDDIQHRPKNFDNPEKLKFLKLTNALVNHPSAAITLAFERLNYVVENNMFSKDEESIIDGLY